ncbi:unnamed protein product, partial [Enterobius vermicularis]|uniref:CCG1 protein n=1 Tax=Enterobius vermicularis TaxID=51028 RepID=A0A0N4VII0_ENTVE
CNQPRRFHIESYSPDSDVLTSFVLPTIGFCIAIIIAMLCGIHKIREWELEKIIETRRKRRVVERITRCLREKNLQTLERKWKNFLLYYFDLGIFKDTSLCHASKLPVPLCPRNFAEVEIPANT